MSKTQKIIAAFVGCAGSEMRQFQYAIVKSDLHGMGGFRKFQKGERVKVSMRSFGRDNWLIEKDRGKSRKPFIPLIHQMCGVEKRYLQFVL